MKYFKLVLVIATLLVASLFVMGIDSIYANNCMIEWILVLVFLGILDIKFDVFK